MAEFKIKKSKDVQDFKNLVIKQLNEIRFEVNQLKEAINFKDKGFYMFKDA